MLDPAAIVTAVTTALQTNTALVSAMGGDDTRIFSFYDRYGIDVPLHKAFYEMKAPGVMVAWEGNLAGNFNGQSLIKHKILIFARGSNNASVGQPVSNPTLWWIITDSPLSPGAQNIRRVNLLPTLQLMDTPAAQVRTDEDGIDYIAGTFVIPEIGDA